MSQQITESIIIKVPAQDAYRIWSDFTQLPHFMDHVKSVKLLGNGVSEWVVDGPLGTNITWTAEQTRNEPGKRIAWNTKDHEGSLTTSGQVTFNQLSHDETQVTVTMQYTAPGGKVGDWLAGALANPDQSVTEDLRRFKQYAESVPASQKI
jgi:uncharacterized membrane protein